MSKPYFLVVARFLVWPKQMLRFSRRGQVVKQKPHAHFTRGQKVTTTENKLHQERPFLPTNRSPKYQR